MADIWVNILGDASKLKGELDKADSHVSGFSEKIGKIGKIATIAGAAVTGAFTAIILKTAAVGDQFDKMSLRTGIAVEDLSALAYAGDISGTSIETIEKGLKGLTTAMDDASKGIGLGMEAFKELDISVTDSDGNLRSTIDVLKEAAAKISAIENPTKQAALAMDLFGAKAGPELLPLLKAGEGGIEELMNRAKELGITMSTEAAAKAAEFTDRITDLKGSLAGAGRTIGDTLIPAIIPLIEKVTEIVGKVVAWTKENPELVATITKVVAVVGVAAAVGGPILMLVSAFNILAPAIALVGTIATGPIGLVIIAVTAIIAAWKNWDVIVEFVGSFVEKIVTFLTDLRDMAIEKVQDMIDKVMGIFDKIKGLIDKVKGWGKSISEALGNGLSEGNPRIDKAMGEVVETVAKPIRSRSPVEYGELKYMRQWGKNLIGEYALGISDGISDLDLVLKYTGEKIEDTIDNTTSAIGDLISDLRSAMVSGLSDAFYSVLSGAKTFGEAMKDLWKSMIDAILQQIAKLAASWLINLIFPGGGLLSGILGFNKGGGVGYQFGGEVKKYQFGGLADTVMAKLDIGEYVISKPMTDFIKKFKAIPQNLVEAISGGLPTPVPAFAGGGSVGTPNITAQGFGETKIYIDIHDNRIASDVDIKRMAITISDEVLRKIEMKRRY